jgi:hypothetical protein
MSRRFGRAVVMFALATIELVWLAAVAYGTFLVISYL